VLLLAVTCATGAAQDAPQAQSEFKRLLDAGDYPAAVEQARRVVDLTEQANPAPSEALQVALMNLALATTLPPNRATCASSR
jgi:hypothetical protein